MAIAQSNRSPRSNYNIAICLLVCKHHWQDSKISKRPKSALTSSAPGSELQWLLWGAWRLSNWRNCSCKVFSFKSKWIKMVWECMKELEWKATCASRSWNRPGSFFVAGSTLQALSTFMSFPKLLWNLWCHPSLHGHPAERWDFQGCPGQTSVLRWNTCSMWWLWIPLEIKHLYIF